MLDVEEYGAGYDARGQVSAIPPAYLTKFQALKFRRGIPVSWIAAVCSRSGYSPTFQTTNIRQCAGTNIITTTVRQFGLAGIWGDIPELEMDANRCGAGWATKQPWISCTTLDCGCYIGTTFFTQGLIGLYMDVDKNLELATDILLSQAEIVRNVCGRVTNALFYRWMLGCRLAPECQILNLPPIFTEEPDTLLQLQWALADELGEERIPGPAGPPGPPGPAGPGAGWLIAGALGLLGLLGLVGLAGKGEQGQAKAAQARRKRAEANRLRMQAASERVKGNPAKAAQMESRATQLDAEATRLEQEALRESAKAYERRR